MSLPAASPPPLSIAVAIATAGRRELIADIVGEIGRQRRLPDRIAICPARPDDIDRDALATLALPLTIVEAPIGLCAQRNGLMRALGDVDVILFLDDDFVMAPDYISRCLDILTRHRDVAMVTGAVIADGILGPGLTIADAHAALAADRAPAAERLQPVHNGYGCNMAIRMAPVREHGLWFDEDLPLYGWLEDVDFSRRLRRYGGIVRADACRGVHMGVKRGRSPGVRLGYSQVANPHYLWRKGSLSARVACTQATRNLVANLARQLRPEPWVDRRGRMIGNLLGLADLLRGRIDPRRAREFG